MVSIIKKICILCSLIFFFSCKKNETAQPAYLGYDFFPSDTGRYITYNVTEIIWNDFYNPPQIDTSYYQLKEFRESIYKDNEDRNCIRIERYQKNNDTLNWELEDVWSACATNKWVEKTEENVKYMKLVFPLKEGTFWDGNLFNTNEEQEYSFEDVFRPYTINEQTFDSTVIVSQKEEITLINRDLQYEIYARNVGMIYKRFLQVQTETSGEIKSGLDVTYEIKEWN